MICRPDTARVLSKKVPSLILGMKGASNQYHGIGGGRGIHGFVGFLPKGLNTFTHDCTVSGVHPWAGLCIRGAHAEHHR